MIRTQIQLTEKQSKSIKKIAYARKVSMAMVIREGMEAYLQYATPVSSEERQQRALSISGRFHSKHRNLAANHDQYLVEDYLK